MLSGVGFLFFVFFSSFLSVFCSSKYVLICQLKMEGGRSVLQLSLELVNQNVGKNVLNLSRLS